MWCEMTNRIYELIIFDFDGTMSDSMWIWEKVNEKFFQEHHIEYNDELKKKYLE